MNRHSRFITAILAAMLLVSACTVTAFAEDGGDISYIEPSYDDQTSYNQPSYDEPSYDEPSYDEPSYDEPSYAEPSYNEPSYAEPSYNDDYNDNGNSGGITDNNVYYDANGNTYSDYSEVYVGGDQTYTPPASTAPSAPLFDTSKTKVDENTLTSSDWNDIKSKLSGSSTKTNSGSGDFAFIQNNTSSGDNGHMILITGFALIVLSVAGFVFLIASAVSRRKKTALAHAGKAANSSGGNRYRSNSDYDDDYSSDSRKGKPKNGKRYK